eukprot:5254167-Pleurochrysis_carterae.AAC.1
MNKRAWRYRDGVPSQPSSSFVCRTGLENRVSLCCKSLCMAIKNAYPFCQWAEFLTTYYWYAVSLSSVSASPEHRLASFMTFEVTGAAADELRGVPVERIHGCT